MIGSAGLGKENLHLKFGDALGPKSVTTDALNFGPEEIAKTFDVPVHELPPACLEYLARCDMRFRYLRGHEREHIILKVLGVLNQPLEVSGPARKARWESGWSENLEGFIQSEFDLTELLPKYYKSGEIMRWNGEYLLPLEGKFEVQFFTLLRLWLFSTYFSAVSHVYEFGCGTGHNLVILRNLFPKKQLIGLDWAQSSQETLALLNQKIGLGVEGEIFDMFTPNASFPIAPQGGVLTMGALEQLGSSYLPFVEFLLQKKPSICVHVEPIFELYDQTQLFDYLGASYHQKRGYFKDFLTTLRKLEAQGVIEILKIRKTLGSMCSDGYTMIAWKPLS